MLYYAHMSEKFVVKNSFPHNPGDVYVDQDHCESGDGYCVLYTDGVATCLAVTMYDPQTKRGVMAHISGLSTNPPDLMPDRVVDTLISRFDLTHLNYLRLEASFAGEAFLYPDDPDHKAPTVRTNLQNYGIKIIGEDLSPGPGSLVYLDCYTGNVLVYRF